MKTFPNNISTFKISFICDLCGVPVMLNLDFSEKDELNMNAICPICHKSFAVNAIKGAEGKESSVSVQDIDDDDITLTF
jgi:hypothetical protein